MTEEQQQQRVFDEILVLEQRLKTLRRFAEGRHTQFRVPITFDNYHNGVDVHDCKDVWARDERDAIEEVTIGPHGLRWCDVEGEVLTLHHGPLFSELFPDG